VAGRTRALTDRWTAASRVLALLATPLLAAGGAGAFAQSYVVDGTCRDGAPNGAYALRTHDGRLRIVGAFAHGRRTGTFLFWSASGSRIAVIPYDEDKKVGTVALWYAPAAPNGEERRKLESAYSADLPHGYTRSWHANGRPRAEYRYERGELAAAQAWTESGEPLPETEARRLAARDLAADSGYFARLEQTIAENTPRRDRTEGASGARPQPSPGSSGPRSRSDAPASFARRDIGASP
jgi:antitoxin component YwqK of YwqJK toxin-antitoxin module